MPVREPVAADAGQEPPELTGRTPGPDQRRSRLFRPTQYAGGRAGNGSADSGAGAVWFDGVVPGGTPISRVTFSR